MWKAMAYKELRETVWIAGLALVAYVYLIAGLTGLRVLPMVVTSFLPSVMTEGIPFVGDVFLWGFGFLALALTLGLGLRQTLGESLGGTWLLLLHRPVDRRILIGVKLAVGAGLYCGSAALMVLLYAWWAATPGTHASPFDWAMTADSWRVLVSVLVMYLAAFLTGLRPGRWLGSRLLPIAAAGLLVVVIQSLPHWWILGVGALALLAAWLLACIEFVVRARDFS